MNRHLEIRAKLEAIAGNLWWTWQPDAVALFRDLDRESFEQTTHDAHRMLSGFEEARWNELSNDEVVIARTERCHAALERYLDATHTWGCTYAGALRPRPVAYFSAEFGLHESFPMYSGGLGILAGDHLKSASDLGLPLVGVGLFYREGYFRQRIGPDGRQVAEYQSVDPSRLATRPLLDAGGRPVIVEVPFPEGAARAQVFVVTVGRVRLLLLEALDGQLDPRVASFGTRLYPGDERIRIRQEMLLGIGGVRALVAAGVEPGVIHLNEGHPAFALLELARMQAVRDRTSFWDALSDVTQRTVFTTHTPVPAGHDRFHPDALDSAIQAYRSELGVDREALLALGRVRPEDHGEPFCMTVLAMKHARSINGVSALHGRVTRSSWRTLFLGRRVQDVPIGHVTNGIHTLSWLAPEMHDLYSRRLGADWPARIAEPATWSPIANVSEQEIWDVRRILKRRLVRFVRARLVQQRRRWQASEAEIAELQDFLDPSALVVGFARRFATYKRADLLLSDVDRLERLVGSADRPVHVIFAGKAHPADQPGQELIRRIFQLSLEPRFRGRIVFLERYNIEVARHLVQGVDLWLNTPERPMEACGTSGMKSVVNGGLHMSVMDGWWPEAFDGDNGFCIASRSGPSEARGLDVRDAEAAFSVLEEDVVPSFYDRHGNGLPREWVRRIKRSIASLAWRFNTDRMVRDYALGAYLPAADAVTSSFPSR